MVEWRQAYLAAHAAPGPTAGGVDYDLVVSRNNWVTILTNSITLDTPGRVFAMASATAAFSCPIGQVCNHDFTLALNTKLEDPGDARRVQPRLRTRSW